MTALADASGRFTIEGLVDNALAGPYQVVASPPPRFADLRLPSIQVTADQTTTYPAARVALDESFSGVRFAPSVPPDASHPDAYPSAVPGCDTLPDGVHTPWVQFADDAGDPSGADLRGRSSIAGRPPTSARR